MEAIHFIEKKMGRKKVEHWGSRILDIDIIFYDEVVMSSEYLTLPHPLLEQRNFVLRPLMDIIPEKRHPVTGAPISTLYATCRDLLRTKRLRE